MNVGMGADIPNHEESLQGKGYYSSASFVNLTFCMALKLLSCLFKLWLIFYLKFINTECKNEILLKEKNKL